MGQEMCMNDRQKQYNKGVYGPVDNKQNVLHGM